MLFEKIKREMQNSGLTYVCCVLLIAFFPLVHGRGVNGGADCASCTIALGVIEHLTIVYNESIVSSLERFCNYLPSQFRVYCKEAVDFLGRSMFILKLFFLEGT